MSSRKRILSFLKFLFFATIAAFRVKHVDLIFATSTPLTIAVPGIMSSLFHRRPLVFEVRDLWPEIPIQLGVIKNRILILTTRLLERITYRKSKAIIALSPGMKQGIIEVGIDPRKISVVPNASDIELLNTSREAAEMFHNRHPEIATRRFLLYAGAFGKVNDLDFLIHLAALVKGIDPEIGFVLIGQGSEKPRIIEEANRRGLLGKNVYIYDTVSKNDLHFPLSAATVSSSFFIDVPILEHNSANKVFDAFAAGKPLVINYGGWQADLLREYRAGLVLWRRDIKGSAEMLARHMNDDQWLDEAGAASRKIASDLFDRKILLDKLEKVLLAAQE